MIWLRRILAIPLIILFVITFVLGLVLCHLSGTVGSAGFYNGQMRKAHVYVWVHESLLPAVLDEAGVESPSDFPVDTPELKQDILVVARAAFPPEWLEQTFKGATKQMVPYIVGDKNSFVITIDVRSRIDPMAEGIKDVVDSHATEIYDWVTEDLFVPYATEQLALGAELPYDIAFTDEEIRGLVASAMPEDWAIAQFKSIVDTLAGYLKGEINSLNLSVSLTDVKAGATTYLNDLTDEKLTAVFESIEATCASEADFLATLNPDTLPSCKPAGYTYSQFKQALEMQMGMTFEQRVKQDVIDLVPNSYVFDESQLREMLGEDMVDTLTSAREFIVVDNGQITEEDLRKSDDGANDAEEEDFDNVRSAIHTVKMFIWVFWLVSILLLVAIGFLCGRNWKSRLLWPLCVLFVTSLVFVILVGVARAVAPLEERMVERPDGEDATQAAILLSDKADEIAHNAVNALIWGLELKLILFAVFSGLAIAGVVAWMIVDRRRHQRAVQNDPQSPAP
ncbi:MAG: hypothetical protein QUS33_07520 [Dehalococcoidia bacterium]|nr:hypothetical protein [Dehalococcoidia bacterium]